MAAALSTLQESPQESNDEVKFIQDHFKLQECSRFVADPKYKSCKVKDIICHCGESYSMHDGIRGKSDLNLKILPKEYKKTFKSLESEINKRLPKTTPEWKLESPFIETTNGFGEIEFNAEQIKGKTLAKYVRLSPGGDSADNCLHLMKEFWHLMEPNPPKLVISVVSSHETDNLNGDERSIFLNELIKAAKTTNAWLITSGFNMGVMKSVGKVVHDGQTFQVENDRLSDVRCIGITPWRYVKNREDLKSGRNGKFPAKYCTSTSIENKQLFSLNPDHTHFIFVDDRYKAFDDVVEFRSNFEKRIAQDATDGGLGIPVVLLLVEGGLNELKHVNFALSNGIPVVVCAGTGGAAGILESFFDDELTTSNQQQKIEDPKEKVKAKIQNTFQEANKEGDELDKLAKDVISCQPHDLMVIFSLKEYGELDLAILNILLKGKINSPNSQLESQLELTMTWNRADIAQKEIFTKDLNWTKEISEIHLTNALIEDKIEFVKLLLKNVISMKNYLTTDRLEDLYNKIPTSSYDLYQVLTKHAKYVHPVALQEDSNAKPKFNVDKIHHFLHYMLGDEKGVEVDRETQLIKKPFKQLLIWAVLMKRNELARLFLELGDEPITSALICTVLCSGMESKVQSYLSDTRKSFLEMKYEFEKQAIDVLDQCYSNSRHKAVMLVKRKSKVWSDKTCLQIAVSASDQAFVSSVACQNSIDNIWRNGIVSSWPKVFISAIVPPLILLCVHINQVTSGGGSTSTEHRGFKGGGEDNALHRKKRTEIEVDANQMENEVKNKKQKVYQFYRAPVSKLALHTAAYLAFLALFTYMISVDYKPVPTTTEWVAVVWIFTFLIGQIHSLAVLQRQLPKFSWTISDYFGILDKLNLVLALCAFCVRWSHVSEGKIIYCINAIIFYISFMKVYTANKTLGPKIYMINRMLVELGMFIMVLVVFLLAYGVASQALLYKHRETSWLILKDIVYFPYWQLFGELFLEDLETDETCTAALQASMGGTLSDADNTCRTYHWLVPILLALYLLIGNVLLLNLLIAIFSHVFDTVEQNSIEIWKFQMYLLVLELENKYIVPPPFDIFFNTWDFIHWIYNRLRGHRQRKTEKFTKDHSEYLSGFEKEMQAKILRTVKTVTIDSLNKRMDELTKMIKGMTYKSSPHEKNISFSRISPHEKNILLKMEELNKMIERITDTISPHEKKILLRMNEVNNTIKEITDAISEEASLPPEKNKQEANIALKQAPKKILKHNKTQEKHNQKETSSDIPESNSCGKDAENLNAMVIDEENQPQNQPTDLNFLADNTVNAQLQPSSSRHQISHHGYSGKDGKRHEPDDNSNNSNSTSLTIYIDVGDQPIIGNEDLVPVEQTLPTEGITPRETKKSKKHSAKKMDRNELVYSTDSDSPQRNTRGRRYMKQESDDNF